MRFLEFLNESKIEIPTVWYHGTKVDFPKFDLKYIITENSIAQNGPGFYLSSDPKDAEKYGYGKESGYLKTVKLLRKSGLKSGKYRAPRPEYIGSLINRMPNKEDVLSNWAEDPNVAMRDLKRSIIESSDTMLEMVLNVWADCFMGHELELVKILLGRGLDGFVINQQNNVKHLICYNPEILKIVSTEKI